MRRFILISIGVVLAFLIVTLGTAWYLLNDDAFLKSQLSDIVLNQTGRKLTVSGPLKLDIGKETRIEASRIQFENAAWAKPADMVSIGRLQITIDIPSLWGGIPSIPLVAVEDCVIGLLKNDAGEANWDVMPPAEPESEPPPPPEDVPVQLREIRINNCHLTLDGPHREQALVVEVNELALHLLDDTRWQGNGVGSVNEDELMFDGWLAPAEVIFLGGPLDHQVTLKVGDTSLESSGTLEDAFSFTGANISARVKGPEIANVLKYYAAPAVSEGDFDFRLHLDTQNQMTRLQLDGDLGSLQAQAEGELDRLVKPGKGNLSMSMEGPNLAALAQVFQVNNLVADPFEVHAEASFTPGTVRIEQAVLETSKDRLELSGELQTGPGLAGTAMDVQLNSSDIGRWAPAWGHGALVVGAITLDGHISSDSNGLFSIDTKVVQDQSKLELSGAIGYLPDRIQADLEVNFHSANPRPLASLIGHVNFPEKPASLTGHISTQEQWLSLEKVEFGLAASQAVINGKVNLADHYEGSELNAFVDIANIANLGRLFGIDDLPAEPLKMNAELKPEGKGLRFKISDGNAREVSADLEGHIADLDKPREINATFDLRTPNLQILSFLVPGTQLPNAPFAARGHLYNDTKHLRLEKIEIDLSGNQARIDGHVNFAEHFAGSELNAKIDISDMGEFGNLFGLDSLPREPLNVSATIRPEGKGLRFNISDGDMGEIRLDLDGHIANLDNPLGLDATFNIFFPSHRVITFLLPDLPLPPGTLAANGRMLNQSTKTRLDKIQLVVGKTTVSVDGEITPDKQFKLDISANGPDASKLSELVGQTLPPDPFSVETHLTGSPESLDMSGLAATLGKSQVDGNVHITMGSPKKIRGKLESGFLDLSHLNPANEPEEPAPPPAESDAESDFVFGEKESIQIDDYGVDINMDLSVAELDLGNTQLLDLHLGLLLAPNQLELNPISVRGRTGDSISGALTADTRGALPQVNLRLHARELRLGLLAVKGQDTATFPPADFDLEIAGSGKTRREMASGLNGKIRVHLGSGKIASAGIGLLMSDFITELFTLLNPFAESSEYTNLDCAVAAADIVSGQVAVNPFIFHTEQLTILTEGQVDLTTEKIDLAFNTKVRKGLGLSAGMIINPLIKVGGRLASPAIELDPGSAVVKGGTAVATVGLSLLAKGLSDRFLSSKDPCGDAQKKIDELDAASD